MGTWGVNTFDNDLALDWANMVIEEDDKELIIVALKEIANEEDYIEAPECIEALCAIETIAALKVNAYDLLPDAYKEWVENQGEHAFDETTIALAKKVLKRITSDSELLELWEESDYYQDWMDVQNRIYNDLDE
jgi:hypothetical protein